MRRPHDVPGPRRVPWYQRRQLPWFKDLVVGSIIQSPGGQERVVRAVSRFNNGDLCTVTLLIQRCSWTGRCYTVLGYTDLRVRKFRLVRAKPRRLRGEFHDLVRAALRQDHERPEEKPFTLSCCDVVGIP